MSTVAQTTTSEFAYDETVPTSYSNYFDLDSTSDGDSNGDFYPSSSSYPLLSYGNVENDAGGAHDHGGGATVAKPQVSSGGQIPSGGQSVTIGGTGGTGGMGGMGGMGMGGMGMGGMGMGMGMGGNSLAPAGSIEELQLILDLNKGKNELLDAQLQGYIDLASAQVQQAETRNAGMASVLDGGVSGVQAGVASINNMVDSISGMRKDAAKPPS